VDSTFGIETGINALRGRILPFLFKIPFGKVFLNQTIEQDKKVSAAHFPDFQVRFAILPVAPAIWQYCVGISSDNCLQGQFDSQVEMR
jgi:hypothetical protein